MPKIMTKEPFDELLKHLKSGWEIEEPVFSQFIRYDQHTVYHFRLRNGLKDDMKQLIVPSSNSLQRFLVRNNVDTSDISWRSKRSFV